MALKAHLASLSRATFILAGILLSTSGAVFAQSPALPQLGEDTPAVSAASPVIPRLPATTAEDIVPGDESLDSTQHQQNKLNQPLYWADGITKIDDLDAYKEAGLNTVVLHLPWKPSETGEISADNVLPYKNFAKAAAAKGLKIVYALPAAPQGLENTLRIAADSPPYLTLWSAWVSDAMDTLRDTPNLVGWMLPDDPRGLPIFDDTGFRRYLAANFASVTMLNQNWNSRYKDFDSISMSDVDGIVARWRGVRPTEENDPPEGGIRAEAANIPANSNLAFHPAALVLAMYKRDCYRALLTSWVGTIRDNDNSQHLVLSGRLPDYAQCLTLPEGIDVSVPDLSPTIAENDIVTHNPQAIDIARRGGRFQAVPMLSLHGATTLPTTAIPDLIQGWMETALARGASGLAFDSWPSMRDMAKLRGEISQTLLKNTALNSETPVNTTAVLLTPLADGATLQVQDGDAPRGLYGWCDDMVNGEPSNLVWSLRWGTAFGGIDYLSADDMDASLLERYNTILAPQMLDVPPLMADRLTAYVQNGGVLVTDLGAASAQNGGFANALSPQLTQLFGVLGQFDIRPINFNINGAQAHPLFPTWDNMMNMRPGLSLTLGDGPDGTAFVGPSGFAPALGTAEPLAIGPQLPQQLGMLKRLTQVQLSINNWGAGQAIFAPFRLWTNWRPGHAGFDSFHGDLFARGATLALPTENLTPAPGTIQLGQTLFPEVIDRPHSIILLNHEAPTQPSQFSTIDTTGVGDWLWSNCLTQLQNGPVAALNGGRPAPVEAQNDLEKRPRPLRIYAVINPGEEANCQILPIAAQNLSGGSLVAQVISDDEKGINAQIWSNAQTVQQTLNGWQPNSGEASTFRLTIESDDKNYHFAPGSRHRATIMDYMEPGKKKDTFATSQVSAIADNNSRLTFEFKGTVCSIKIAPENIVSGGVAKKK